MRERARERVVGRLQRDYARGELGTETFERRIEDVLRADSTATLRQATLEVAAPSLLARLRDRLLRRTPPPSGLLAALAGERPTVIGRSRSCDLVLRDDTISRRHAMLRAEGDRMIVTDLGSTNGTLLNGRWVTEAEAQPGDVLRLGLVELRL